MLTLGQKRLAEYFLDWDSVGLTPCGGYAGKSLSRHVRQQKSKRHTVGPSS